MTIHDRDMFLYNGNYMEIERYRNHNIRDMFGRKKWFQLWLTLRGKLRLAISFPLVIIIYRKILAWGNPERGDMTNMRLEFPIDWWACKATKFKIHHNSAISKISRYVDPCIIMISTVVDCKASTLHAWTHRTQASGMCSLEACNI